MKKKFSFGGITAIMALCSIVFPLSTMAFCTDEVEPQYLQAAQKLYADGHLKGYPDGSCRLQQKINRIEFTVMAMRAGFGDQSAKSSIFKPGLYTDLTDSDKWYSNYAATAHKLKILQGDNGFLHPNRPVMFGEAALITVRTGELVIQDPADHQKWHQPVSDIFQSSQVSTYPFNHQMTRGEVVLLLHQFYQNYSELEAAAQNYNPFTK